MPNPCVSYAAAKILRISDISGFITFGVGPNNRNHYISESFVAVLRNRVFEASFHFRYYSIASNRPCVGLVRLEAEGFIGLGLSDIYCVDEEQPCRWARTSLYTKMLRKQPLAILRFQRQMLANQMNLIVGALLDALLDTVFRERLDSSRTRTIPDTAKRHPSTESNGTTRREIDGWQPLKPVGSAPLFC